MPSHFAKLARFGERCRSTYTAKGSRIGTSPASQSLGHDNQFRWPVCWRFFLQGVETRLSGFHQGLAWGGEEEMRHGDMGLLIMHCFQPWKVEETDGVNGVREPEELELVIIHSIHFR